MRTIDRTDKSETKKCNYCGKSDPENGFTEKGIIHQSRDDMTGKKIVVESRFTVCAGAPCGGYLQMSYEG